MRSELIGNAPAWPKSSTPRKRRAFSASETLSHARAAWVARLDSERATRAGQRRGRFHATSSRSVFSSPGDLFFALARPGPLPRDRKKRDSQIDNRERVDRRARVNALDSLGALGIGATMGCRHSTPRTRGGAALRPRLVPVRAASRDVRDSASSLEAGQLSAHAGSPDSKRPPREDTVDDASKRR